MRIKQAFDNGNVEFDAKQYNIISRLSESRNWLNENHDSTENTNDNYSPGNVRNSDNLKYISNKNIHYNTNNISTEGNDKTVEITLENVNRNTDQFKNVNSEVCNRQYTINTKNNINLVNSENNQAQSANLEGLTESALALSEKFQGNCNVSSRTSPTSEERAFEHSDTDEISENGTQQNRILRGIVNPNYPGFQHFAHTLQDYSSNIENFYHSENEMTDDDVDVVDLSYDTSINKTCNFNNTINNNNITDQSTIINKTIFKEHTQSLISEEINKNSRDIPDLLKNVSNINNNDEIICLDFNCLDTDIENNFNTKDIIGDFNREIEEEIKQLLNYNINIQDDLEELRKDIKDTFAKPIESTINNISEVVNHVIKKLVETQCGPGNSGYLDQHKSKKNQQITEDDSKIYMDNETNSRKEMNLSRPTFLLIESHNHNIQDAFLSDGKDEINILCKEYDTEQISNNVENTIKQLSTELRKIIPKLDEFREQEKFWSNNKTDNFKATDSNLNEIALPGMSKNYKLSPITTTGNTSTSRNVKANDLYHVVRRSTSKHNKMSQKSPIELRTDVSLSSSSSAQTHTSVRKTNSIEDCDLESFDVYNIETAMPTMDLDAIENHLKIAKEAERRKRNDREEIRKRLAMGTDNDEYYYSMGYSDRPGKKPSLHSRLQSGMNLQICFMNETASDNESQASDVEKSTAYSNKPLVRSSIFSKSNYSLNNHPYQTRPLSVNITKHDRVSTMQSGTKLRPSSLTLKTTKSRSSHSLGHIELKESDFHVLQATLQTEARIALAQAKEMARIQMERERRSRPVSPVTEMLRRSMEKANIPLAPDRRRVSRQLLTDMNIAQLQVIVNELHSQIEFLNDTLVKLLMARDELHMGQDSMLVDIEDLTRYLGVKEQTKKTKGNSKSGVKRFTSLIVHNVRRVEGVGSRRSASSST